jgi:hypothetical protein
LGSRRSASCREPGIAPDPQRGDALGLATVRLCAFFTRCQWPAEGLWKTHLHFWRPPGALTPRSLPATLYPGRARMRGPRAYIRPDEGQRRNFRTGRGTAAKPIASLSQNRHVRSRPSTWPKAMWRKRLTHASEDRAWALGRRDPVESNSFVRSSAHFSVNRVRPLAKDVCRIQ